MQADGGEVQPCTHPFHQEVPRVGMPLSEQHLADMTPQACPAGLHADWAVDSEHDHACPWCRIAELEAQAAKVAEFVAARAEYVTAIRETRNDHDYERWQGHAESRRQLAETLGLPVAWPAEAKAGDES
jgi:hypothetical protein